MDRFTFENPTKLIFGKGQMEALQAEVPKYGTRVLVVYGGGSIKKNGIYDKVMNELKAVHAEVFELSGVEPNPRVSTVRKGADICKNNDVDLILAVGGGAASLTVPKPLPQPLYLMVILGIWLSVKLYLKKFFRSGRF